MIRLRNANAMATPLLLASRPPAARTPVAPRSSRSNGAPGFGRYRVAPSLKRPSGGDRRAGGLAARRRLGPRRAGRRSSRRSWLGLLLPHGCRNDQREPRRPGGRESGCASQSGTLLSEESPLLWEPRARGPTEG